jgi:hypothetical protein
MQSFKRADNAQMGGTFRPKSRVNLETSRVSEGEDLLWTLPGYYQSSVTVNLTCKCWIKTTTMRRSSDPGVGRPPRSKT